MLFKEKVNPFLRRIPNLIVCFALQKGVKHPYFILWGYNLTMKEFYEMESEGTFFEDSYELVGEMSVEEMLSHSEDLIRKIGCLLVSNPRISQKEIMQAIAPAPY